MSYDVQTTAAFDVWLNGLTDFVAQVAIVARIVRVKAGSLGDWRSVGDRVSELRIDVGQGYRLYYTMRGRTIIFLLCGGSKKTQKAGYQEGRGNGENVGQDKEEPGGSRVRERQAAYAAQNDEDEEFSLHRGRAQAQPLRRGRLSRSARAPRSTCSATRSRAATPAISPPRSAPSPAPAASASWSARPASSARPSTNR